MSLCNQLNVCHVIFTSFLLNDKLLKGCLKRTKENRINTHTIKSYFLKSKYSPESADWAKFISLYGNCYTQKLNTKRRKTTSFSICTKVITHCY